MLLDRRRAACAVLLASMVSIVSPQTPPSVPDTAPGHAFTAWFEAFNAGDRERIKALMHSVHVDRDVDQQLLLRDYAGGLDLIGIEKSTPTQLIFRVKERNSDAQDIGTLTIDGSKPPRLTNLGIYEMPKGAVYADFPIDAAEKKRVIDAAIKWIDEDYIFPDVAKKLSASLRAHLQHGDYDSFTEGGPFSERITDEMVAISHDQHLGLDFYLIAQPEHKPESKADDDANFRREMARENCGFEKADHLPGNIGYLKINSFPQPDVCGEKAVAAMAMIADSDAVIFDLRDNNGGVPRMIALIASYLFDKPTHLADFHLRKEKTTDQLWTLPYVPGKRLVTQPVFVLLSKTTFSGGEAFAYHLKNLKRATLVGETTAGGANTYAPHRIDAHFVVNVSRGRAVNPTTNANWEGVGVEPDVKTTAADALDTAIKLAMQKLGGK